jgi:spermidine/putrescine-binding protein
MKKYRLVLCFIFAVMLVVPTVLLFAGGQKEKGEPVLSILCFAEAYAIDEWVYPFEEMYDCKVNRTYAGTVEEHYSKTKAAPDQYNIVSIMSSRVQMYYDDGLLQEIPVGQLEHWKELDGFFREGLVETIERGKEFYVPIAWGNQDFIVNTKVVGDQIKPFLNDLGGGRYSLSYDVLKAPQAKGLTALFDEAASLTNMAAIAAGVKDPSNLDERGYERMIAELSAWAQNARAFTAGVDAEKAMLTAEDAYVSLTGNNVIQANLLLEEGYGDTFTHFLPTEGTVLWVDGWIITKPTTTDSAAYDLALKYIDYMIGAEVQTIMSEKVGWGVVNAAGAGGYSDAVKDRTWWYTLGLDNFPVPLYVMKGEEDPPRRERTWNEIKAGIGF